ncbi:pectate lyase, PelA/Pel-15E family [Echinicola vietnamensis DSM 17526]|uniref:Pectate lyase, PelA/Pel-15E family n=2 Tax=Echinicola TaxID=390846 RepID=L0FWC1_ECHVK|nr:pectate lyase, PelA/Pel-15E family [Echinicola vietnamensis DSM 17526]
MFRYLYLALALTWSASTMAQTQDEEHLSWRAAQRQDQEWFDSKEAQRIADNVLLYQHENGGWYKNIDMASKLSKDEKEKLLEEKNKDLGTTIDNGATISQLEYLAKVYAATQEERYKIAFLSGIDYLLEAQYENGGWPQYYPVRKGYYQHITYNDNAMIGVMRLLRKVAEGEMPYDFVGTKRKKAAKVALDKGLEVILATQVKINGQLTIWCAQHDEVSLAPAKARAYELPSLSGSESVNIVRYLMHLPDPTPEVVTAVESAIAWFENHKIKDKAVQRIKDPSLAKGYDLVVVDQPGASPLWARFYDLDTQQPFYVGRDGIKRTQLKDIEYERRVGYSYLGNYAEGLLEKEYPRWKQGL